VKAWPLRLKVTLWAMLVGGVALMVFGTILGISMHNTGLKHLDETLHEEAVAFFESLKDRKEPMRWNDETQLRQLFGLVRSLYVFHVEEPPGNVVFRSRNFGLRESFPEGKDGIAFTAQFDGDEVRALRMTRDGVRVSIAADFGPLEHVETTLWLSYAILLPATLLFIAVGGTWLSKKALRPVEELTAAAERISVNRSGQRLPVPMTNDEIGHLTRVMNAMIERIQQSYEQARRFSADASHELKTPLTIIRGEIEAALRSGNLTAAQERMMLNLQEESGRLVHIVEGLLLLSQADAGKLQLQKVPVDLSAMLEELMEDIEILAAPRGIALKADFAPEVVVQGEPHFLRQVFLNLFDNAIKYNQPNGQVETRLRTEGGLALFSIRNTGTEIPEEDMERIFDRFHRAERSRDRARGGQGLGLSICREIVRAHGGDIVLSTAEKGWIGFELRLPTASVASHPTVTTASAAAASA
jgi:two-component system, OmpR family, heavy metal sensor histidine kinase CusS